MILSIVESKKISYLCRRIHFNLIRFLYMKTNTFMRTLFQIAFLLLINSNLMAQTDSITVRVKGMRCEECAHKVKNVVKKLSLKI